MRIMALDVGKKRIGIAVSDELELTSQPVKTLHRTRYAEDLTYILERVQEFAAGLVVLGMPYRTDNMAQGEMAGEIKRFERDLRAKGVATAFQNESFTTRRAEAALTQYGAKKAQRRAVIDTAAAQMILSDFLDRRRAQTS